MAAAAAAACDRISSDPYNGNISLSATVCADTKAPLSSSDLTAGSTVKVYDVLGSSFDKHINGAIATKGSTEWSFASDYPWMVGTPAEKVDHNFFAWLTNDKEGNTPAALFGFEPAISVNNPDDGIYAMTLPKQMILNQSQFDFCYSDIVSRAKETNNYSVVPLNLHHLFTCFGICARNYTSEVITITSIKLHGLVNNKTATITYNVNTGERDIVYVPDGSNPKSWTTDVNALELVAEHGLTLNAEDAAGSSVANVITHANGGSKSKDTEVYFMMWPQTADEMDASIEENDGVWTFDSSDPVLTVTYRVGSGSIVTVPVALRPESLTGSGWDAGTKHLLELSFTEKFLSLKATVLPWDYSEPEIDFTSGASAGEGGRLSFSGCIFGKRDNADCIYFKNNNPITGYFKLDSPMDASWMISKDGDFDVFEIDNRNEGNFGDGVDYNFGTIDGETAYFTIYPRIEDPQRDYYITLTFVVRTSTGNVINVDELLQPKVDGEGNVVMEDGKIVIEKKRIVLLAS